MIDESSILALIAAQLAATAQRVALAEHERLRAAADGDKKALKALPPLPVFTPSEFIADAEHLLKAVRKARGVPDTAPWETR